MVYLTVWYLGALHFKQCATTVICLTCRWTSTQEASLTHSCVAVRSTANLSQGWPADSQLYDHPLCGLFHQRLSLSDLPLRGLPRTLVVWQMRWSTRVDQTLSKEIPTLLTSLKSTRKIPTLPLTQQRDWHLFSVSPTACTEPNTYSALDWHFTQRIPSPVDRQQSSFKDRSVLFIQIAMNYWSPILAFCNALYVPLNHRCHRSLTSIPNLD